MKPPKELTKGEKQEREVVALRGRISEQDQKLRDYERAMEALKGRATFLERRSTVLEEEIERLRTQIGECNLRISTMKEA